MSMSDVRMSRIVNENLDWIWIYKLKDPRDNKIRYVGKTDDPIHRLKQHLTPDNLDTSKRGRWLSHLLSLGLQPIMELIRKVDKEHALEIESYWIEFYLRGGCDLLNEVYRQNTLSTHRDLYKYYTGEPTKKKEKERSDTLNKVLDILSNRET